MPITAPAAREAEHPLIEVLDAGFSYGKNVVLEHVSFTVKKGDYVGIIGPNGGGKSTLLKLLVGLLPPQTGEIYISGIPIGLFKERFKIGYVPQRIAQDNPSFPATVREIIESGLTASLGVWQSLGKNNGAAIDRVLEAAGIADLKDRLMGSLSGGQRQRVYVARALAGSPELLILDEPFVGIDVAAQQDFYAFLKKLNRQQGLTIVFVSHDIDVITEEVTSVLCLNRGIFCLEDPEQLHEPGVMESMYGKKITHIHKGSIH